MSRDSQIAVCTIEREDAWRVRPKQHPYTHHMLCSIGDGPRWQPEAQNSHGRVASELDRAVQVDRLAQSLMPANLKPLRQMLHATAVEVLLYLTPLHCQDMLDSVVLSLNTVHAKFMQRNPGFDVRRCSDARLS